MARGRLVSRPQPLALGQRIRGRSAPAGRDARGAFATSPDRPLVRFVYYLRPVIKATDGRTSNGDL